LELHCANTLEDGDRPNDVVDAAVGGDVGVPVGDAASAREGGDVEGDDVGVSLLRRTAGSLYRFGVPTRYRGGCPNGESWGGGFGTVEVGIVVSGGSGGNRGSSGVGVRGACCDGGRGGGSGFVDNGVALKVACCDGGRGGGSGFVDYGVAL
jgi:hypothetical protein